MATRWLRKFVLSIVPGGTKRMEGFQKLDAEMDEVYDHLNKIIGEVDEEIEQIRNGNVIVKNADMVDKHHADNTPGNLPILDNDGELTQNTKGYAKFIPTKDIGGNVWIE